MISVQRNQSFPVELKYQKNATAKSIEGKPDDRGRYGLKEGIFITRE